MKNEDKSQIEWTDYSWNPVWGCTKVSPGCNNCYAERMTKRQGGDFSEVRLLPHKLNDPLKIKEPSRIFVNAFSDLFHEKIPDSYRAEIFKIMVYHPEHHFQVLTKRPRRMREYVEKTYYRFMGICNDNIWLGVSVESKEYLWRINELLETSCFIQFVSFEPLLERIPFELLDAFGLRYCSWVIVGGESDYRNPRPMNPEWVAEIHSYCRRYKIPFFFKQWGGKSKCACHKAWGCRLLYGRTWDEFPK